MKEGTMRRIIIYWFDTGPDRQPVYPGRTWLKPLAPQTYKVLVGWENP